MPKGILSKGQQKLISVSFQESLFLNDLWITARQPILKRFLAATLESTFYEFWTTLFAFPTPKNPYIPNNEVANYIFKHDVDYLFRYSKFRSPSVRSSIEMVEARTGVRSSLVMSPRQVSDAADPVSVASSKIRWV